MKSLLTIKISAGSNPVVKKGQKVKSGEIIVKGKEVLNKEKVPLSKILSVKPPKIHSYLVKRLGAKIKKGEPLARKEGIFKSLRVLSPVSGVLDSVDLKDGSVLIIEKISAVLEKTPIDGQVESVNDQEVVLSFEGKIFEAEKGKGDRVIGVPLFFHDEVDMHHFGAEVASKIIIGKTFTEGARAKLGALGAEGIVSLEFYDDFPVLVKVSPKTLKELEAVGDRNIILLGEKRQIIVPVV